MGKFASAETDCNFDLISLVQKFLYMFDFRIKVSCSDFRLHADFLDFQYFLVFLGVTELFLLFKPVFAKIKYFTNRRISRWSNFYKVKIFFFCHSECFQCRYNPFLVALIINQSDLSYTDHFVNPQSLIVCQLSSSVLCTLLNAFVKHTYIA